MRPPPRSAAMGQVQDEACREVDGLPGDPPLGDDADGRGDEASVRPARVGPLPVRGESDPPHPPNPGRFSAANDRVKPLLRVR